MMHPLINLVSAERKVAERKGTSKANYALHDH